MFVKMAFVYVLIDAYGKKAAALRSGHHMSPG
jgi:hypothetical protein